MNWILVFLALTMFLSGFSLLSLVWMRRLSGELHRTQSPPQPPTRHPRRSLLEQAVQIDAERLHQELEAIARAYPEKTSTPPPGWVGGLKSSSERFTSLPVAIPPGATQVRVGAGLVAGMEPVLSLDFSSSTGPSGGLGTTPVAAETRDAGPSPSRTSESAGASSATTETTEETAGPAGRTHGHDDFGHALLWLDALTETHHMNAHDKRMAAFAARLIRAAAGGACTWKGPGPCPLHEGFGA